jgi:hypothetical protein
MEVLCQKINALFAINLVEMIIAPTVMEIKMSKSITYWWKKYQVLRAIKKQYQKEVKDISVHEINAFKSEYLYKFIKEIN